MQHPKVKSTIPSQIAWDPRGTLAAMNRAKTRNKIAMNGIPTPLAWSIHPDQGFSCRGVMGSS